jgi:hypothetical protein
MTDAEDTNLPDAPQSGEADLSDGELRSEIELVADLVVAASQSDGPLTQEEIDEALGVD